MLDKYFKPNVRRGAIIAAIIGIVIGVIGVIPVLNCLAIPITCIVGFGLPLVIGWFVAQWGGATDMGAAAIDGAIATAVGALIAGVIVFVLDVILGFVFNALGLAAGNEVPRAAMGFIVEIVSKFVGHIIARPIFAAIFGAVGGLLYVAIQGNKAKAA
jgi:hypothetical protein